MTSGGLAAVSASAFAALYSAFGKYDVVHIHAEGPAFFTWLPKMFGKRVVVGYQSSTVLDEPEREAGTTSIPIPQREESENIPLPDLPGQLENVQQSGNEIAERGMPT